MSSARTRTITETYTCDGCGAVASFQFDENEERRPVLPTSWFAMYDVFQSPYPYKHFDSASCAIQWFAGEVARVFDERPHSTDPLAALNS